MRDYFICLASQNESIHPTTIRGAQLFRGNGVALGTIGTRKRETGLCLPDVLRIRTVKWNRHSQSDNGEPE